MSKAPPIPPAQRAEHDARPDAEAALRSGKDEAPTAKDRDGGKVGKPANLRQNTTHSGNVQDR